MPNGISEIICRPCTGGGGGEEISLINRTRCVLRARGGRARGVVHVEGILKEHTKLCINATACWWSDEKQTEYARLWAEVQRPPSHINIQTHLLLYFIKTPVLLYYGFRPAIEKRDITHRNSIAFERECVCVRARSWHSADQRSEIHAYFFFFFFHRRGCF